MEYSHFGKFVDISPKSVCIYTQVKINVREVHTFKDLALGKATIMNWGVGMGKNLT